MVPPIVIPDVVIKSIAMWGVNVVGVVTTTENRRNHSQVFLPELLVRVVAVGCLPGLSLCPTRSPSPRQERRRGGTQQKEIGVLGHTSVLISHSVRPPRSSQRRAKK